MRVRFSVAGAITLDGGTDRRAIALGRKRRTGDHGRSGDLADALECVDHDSQTEIVLGLDGDVLPVAATTTIGDVRARGLDSIVRCLEQGLQLATPETFLVDGDLHLGSIAGDTAIDEDHPTVRTDAHAVTALGDSLDRHLDDLTVRLGSGSPVPWFAHLCWSSGADRAVIAPFGVTTFYRPHHRGGILGRIRPR